MQNTPLIKMSELAETIRQFLDSDINVPLMLLGPPGIGKTECVRHECDAMGYRIVEVKLTTRDPGDIGGYVGISADGKESVTTMPALIAQLHKIRAETEQRIVLFFDEFTQAQPLTQASIMSLVNEGEISGYAAPAGVSYVLAGNAAHDNAAAGSVIAPMVNRVAMFNVEPELNHWLSYAESAGYYPGLLAAIEHCSQFFSESAREDSPFATPRAWSKVNALVTKFGERFFMNPNLIAGLVGMDAATHICVAMRDVNVPTPSQLAMTKESLKKFSPIMQLRIVRNCAAYAAKNAAAIVALLDSVESCPDTVAASYFAPLRAHIATNDNVRESLMEWIRAEPNRLDRFKAVLRAAEEAKKV